MNKEQTALQRLIDDLENFVKELDQKYDGDPLVKRGVIISIAEAKKKLPVERQQIEEAHQAGHEPLVLSLRQDAMIYYTEKYGS